MKVRTQSARIQVPTALADSGQFPQSLLLVRGTRTACSILRSSASGCNVHERGGWQPSFPSDRRAATRCRVLWVELVGFVLHEAGLATSALRLAYALWARLAFRIRKWNALCIAKPRLDAVGHGVASQQTLIQSTDEGVPMIKLANYSQPCPVCDRTLILSHELLGCQLVCSHCGAEFTSHEFKQRGARSVSVSILDRADALLEEVRVYLDHCHSHLPHPN